MALAETQVLAPTQVWQELASGILPLGRALERNLSTDLQVEAAVWTKASEMHAAFWDNWANWRHALPGAQEGSFHDIVRMFHFEEHLVAHMELQPGDLVVDLGCGRAWMAQFMPDATVSYLGVDSHSATVVAAKEELCRLGFTGDIVEYDLLAGLPESVIEVITRAERARILARWAFYLPIQSIVRIVKQAFEAGAYDLTVDQLTAGKFSPPSLMIHYMPFLAKGLVRKELSGIQVIRALKALKRMIPYGLELKKLFPLWSSDQIAKALNGLGCEVEVLERPLWRQTTFLKVTYPTPPIPCEDEGEMGRVC